MSLDELKHIRELLGISQNKLAKQLRLDPAIISRIEHGWRPHRGNAVMLIEAWIITHEQESIRQLKLIFEGQE